LDGIKASEMSDELCDQFRCQFYQQFTRTFFVRKCFAQLLSNYSLALNFWQKNIGAKAAQKMLMKLTKGVNFANSLRSSFYTNIISPKNYKAKLFK